MDKVTLGRTGLEVPKFGVGGAWCAIDPDGQERSRKLIHRALEFGMNYIDTAAGYGDSEESIGKVIKDIKEPIIISTKLGGRPDPFDAKNIDYLRQSVETSLKLLHREQIDILMIHEPDRPGEYDWWTDRDAYTGPVTDLMAELKEKELIRFTGLGGTTAYELGPIIRSGQFDVVLTAFNYSLLWREAEIDVIPACKEVGAGVVSASPLQQGGLVGRFDNEVNNGALWMSKPRREQYKALYAYLDEIEMDIVECAIRFVLNNTDVDCVMNGARDVPQLEQNVAAFEKGPLPADILARLDEIHTMVPFRPFEEPFGIHFNGPKHRNGPGPA